MAKPQPRTPRRRTPPRATSPPRPFTSETGRRAGQRRAIRARADAAAYANLPLDLQLVARQSRAILRNKKTNAREKNEACRNLLKVAELAQGRRNPGGVGAGTAPPAPRPLDLWAASVAAARKVPAGGGDGAGQRPTDTPGASAPGPTDGAETEPGKSVEIPAEPANTADPTGANDDHEDESVAESSKNLPDGRPREIIWPDGYVHHVG